MRTLSSDAGVPISARLRPSVTPRTVIHDQTDESYIIEEKYNQRPDMLAYDRFGSAKFWWVFSMRNKDQLVDPIQDFRAGVTIRIPKIENVR